MPDIDKTLFREGSGYLFTLNTYLKKKVLNSRSTCGELLFDSGDRLPRQLFSYTEFCF